MEAIMRLGRGPVKTIVEISSQGSRDPLAASLRVLFCVEETGAGGDAEKKDWTLRSHQDTQTHPTSVQMHKWVHFSKSISGHFWPPFIRRLSRQRGLFMWQLNTYDSS